MVEEQALTIPEGLEQWLDDRTATTDQDRDEVLARALATYRLLSERDEALAEVEMPPLDEQLADLEQRIDELAADTDEQIQDVRDRVVQVMTTARAKADPEHDHPALASDVERIDDDLADLSESLDGLQTELDSFEERVDGGFENYETILSSLTDRADDVDGKLDTLAGAVVDLRKRALELESANARRTAVEELQTDANVRRVSAGDCQSCGETVRLALLSEPRCPHCREQFDGIEPAGRFLGSATLTVGDRPALAGDAFEPEEPGEVFEEDD